MSEQRLLDAIRDMGDAFSQNERCGSLTCKEFRQVLDVFVLAGLPEQGKAALISHASGDTEDGDEHHDLYQSDDDEDMIAEAHLRVAYAGLGLQR